MADFNNVPVLVDAMASQFRLLMNNWIDPETWARLEPVEPVSPAEYESEEEDTDIDTGGRPLHKELSCSICLESSVAVNLEWFECSRCFTACCTTCLTEYLQRATGESKSLCCPQPDCESKIPEDVSLLLVGAERLAMHQKHLDMKGDPDLRECPHCGVLNRGSADAPDMTCTACSNTFCFHHDLQHAGTKCSKLRGSGTSVLSQLYLSCRTTKCPGCSAPVQRNKGCPHMVCAKCNTDFCYYCGKATPAGSVGTHRRLWSMQCHAPRQWAKRTGFVVAAPVAAGLATAAGGLALAVAPVAGPAYLVQRRAMQRRRREARERLWMQRLWVQRVYT